MNFVSAGLLPLLRALGQAGEHILSLLTLFSMLWAVYWTFLRGRERLTGFAAKTNWGDGETWGHFCVNFGMTLFVLAWWAPCGSPCGNENMNGPPRSVSLRGGPYAVSAAFSVQLLQMGLEDLVDIAGQGAVVPLRQGLDLLQHRTSSVILTLFFNGFTGSPSSG